MMGLPLAGEKMLWGESMRMRRLGLGLDGEGEVDGHLVAVEVGVKARSRPAGGS